MRRLPRVLLALLVLALVPAPAGWARTPVFETAPLGVVLVSGYGTDVATAEMQFGPLRAALSTRVPDAVFVPFSYTGVAFDGCASVASPYTPSDTAQPLAQSEQLLRATIDDLRAACDVERIVIIGHSLGGLIALRALDTADLAGVSDVVTIDSPLGGLPEPVLRACIDAGWCPDGPVVDELRDLHTNWDATAQENSARAVALDAAHTRLTAWGNSGDCFYDVALCGALARSLLGALDARESQWLGIPRAKREDVRVAPLPWNVLPSHTDLLRRAAQEVATDLLP
jgi:pimeloyl-ACP methyl ester carboxylesterase